MSPYNSTPVVDPVLTNIIRGYRQSGRIGHLLFPEVEVTRRSGTVIEFGKEDFMLYNSRRSAGSATKRIEFGHQGKPFALVQDSLESKLPREYADETTQLTTELGTRATTKVMNALTLALEYEQAALATSHAYYDAGNKQTLSGEDQWTHPDSNPAKIVEHARHAIRNKCGLYPNTLILGPKPFSALRNNAFISNRFRNADIVTAEMLGKLFNIEQVVEGTAMMADQSGDFHDVWGNFAVLGYAPANRKASKSPATDTPTRTKETPLSKCLTGGQHQKLDLWCDLRAPSGSGRHGSRLSHH